MYLCTKHWKFWKKVPIKLHILHLKNARVSGAVRQALNTVHHLLLQLHSAMRMESWKKSSGPVNSGSVMGLKHSGFCFLSWRWNNTDYWLDYWNRFEMKICFWSIIKKVKFCSNGTQQVCRIKFKTTLKSLENNEKLPKNLLKTRKKTWNFVSPAKCEPYISAN